MNLFINLSVVLLFFLTSENLRASTGPSESQCPPRMVLKQESSGEKRFFCAPKPSCRNSKHVLVIDGLRIGGVVDSCSGHGKHVPAYCPSRKRLISERGQDYCDGSKLYFKRECPRGYKRKGESCEKVTVTRFTCNLPNGLSEAGGGSFTSYFDRSSDKCVYAKDNNCKNGYSFMSLHGILGIKCAKEVRRVNCSSTFGGSSIGGSSNNTTEVEGKCYRIKKERSVCGPRTERLSKTVYAINSSSRWFTVRRTLENYCFSTEENSPGCRSGYLFDRRVHQCRKIQTSSLRWVLQD